MLHLFPVTREPKSIHGKDDSFLNLAAEIFECQHKCPDNSDTSSEHHERHLRPGKLEKHAREHRIPSCLDVDCSISDSVHSSFFFSLLLEVVYIILQAIRGECASIHLSFYDMITTAKI